MEWLNVAVAFVHFLAVRRQSQRQVRLHHPRRYRMQTKYTNLECLSLLSAVGIIISTL